MRRVVRSSRVLATRPTGERPTPAGSLAPLALLATLAACSGHGSTPVGPVPAPGPPVFGESEPNDDPFLPLVVDELQVGSVVEFQGTVQSAPGWDLIDHFALRATEPMLVRFTLLGASGFDDLDLSVWDAWSGAYVDSWTSPFDPEVGTFLVPGAWVDFSLAVYAPLADADYTLVVQALPCPYGASLPADGADAGDALGADARLATAAADASSGPVSGSTAVLPRLLRTDDRSGDLTDPRRTEVLRDVSVGVRGDAGREPILRVHLPRPERP